MIARTSRARRDLRPQPPLHRVEPLQRLVDAQLRAGDRWLHGRITHQVGCKVSPCTCEPDVIAVLKNGKRIAV